MDEFAQLQAEAEQIDAQGATAPGATPEPAAPAGPDYLTEARGLVDFMIGVAKPLYPSLERVYTKEACDKLAAAAAPVMEKYGMSLGELFKRWGPEINLAFVALPLTLQTLQAVREDRAARRQAQEQADDSAAAAAA